MRKSTIALLAVALFVGVTGAALASSPHFKHGGTPVCTVTNTSAPSSSTTCTASLTGLGAGDVVIDVTVSGFAVYQCQNPGGNLAPGQNRVLEGPVTEPTTVPDSAIKNGNLTFTTDPAVLSAEPTVSGSAAGCPSSGWTGVNPVLTVTSIELSIAQGGNAFYDCAVTDPNGLSGKVSFPASC